MTGILIKSLEIDANTGGFTHMKTGVKQSKPEKYQAQSRVLLWLIEEDGPVNPLILDFRPS